MKKVYKHIILLVLTVFYIICNWLMDWWMNNHNTTNGLWDNLFGFSIITSFHLVWYFSMAIFVFVVIWLIKEVENG